MPVTILGHVNGSSFEKPIYDVDDRRHASPGKSREINLELIEVQTGSYLGEDDIIRLEDDYHR
jgi:mannose-1-phosphate guanylyltransferase / mannose-6-phosphate isomerase